MSRFLAFTCLVLTIALATGLARAEDPAGETAEKAAASQPRWIGVVCHPPSDTLRAQLALPERQGLVVASVVAEGPAAEAGIKPHDILLAGNEEPLRDAEGLSQVVTGSEDKALTLVLLRGGKRQTVTVTPAPRPEQEPAAIAVGGPEQEALREWFEQLVPQNAAELAARPNRRFRLRFLHPGIILGGGDLAANFPKDVSITVNREGEGPLKITVEKDGETWEVNRDELGKLPQNLLPLVERMLGDRDIPSLPEGDFDLNLPDIGLPKVGVPGIDNPPGIELPKVAPPRAIPPAAGLEPSAPGKNGNRLEKQLKELQQRLDELQKELERKQDKTSE